MEIGLKVFSSMETVDMKLSSPGETIAVKDYSDIIRVTPPNYRGEYNVRPKVDESIELPTENTYLDQNVNVEKVPTHTVSNDSGGLTFIIGDEYFGK